jgi:DNA-binding transcriptional MocR family regulator
LPSVRRLAVELEVSPATVASAYRDLRSRGIVTGRSRGQTTVSLRPPLRIWAEAPVPVGTRDLATGNPDRRLLPDIEEALRSVAIRTRLYREPPVVPEFAAAARIRLEEIGLDGSEFTVVGGAMDGIERVLQAHLRPGDRVAVEDPGYSGVLDLLAAMGFERCPVRVDNEGMIPEDNEGMIPDGLAETLRFGVSAVVLTPHAQNPTGAFITRTRAADLSAVLDSAPEVIVVEDDHLGLSADPPYGTLVERRSRWAFVRSVSKTLGPDLRVALLTGDPVTVSRVEGRMSLGAGWISGVLQRLVAALWNDPGVDALVKQAARTYSARRQALIAALRRRNITAFGASGLNVWIPVTQESSVVGGLLEKGWAVRAGEAHRLTAPPAVRVTAATLEQEEAEAFSEDMLAVLHPPHRTRIA